MDKVTFKLRITSGVDLNKVYFIEVSTLDEVKTAILKRLGNLYASNKANKEKKLVKKIIYDAKSIKEITSRVRRETRWVIVVSNLN